MTHGEGKFAAIIDCGETDADGLADFEDVGNFVDTFVADLGDVEHAVNTGKDSDEGAEIFDGGNCALIDFADFWFFDEGFDPVESFLDGDVVVAGNGDEAGVFDVDLSTGF